MRWYRPGSSGSPKSDGGEPKRETTSQSVTGRRSSINYARPHPTTDYTRHPQANDHSSNTTSTLHPPHHPNPHSLTGAALEELGEVGGARQLQVPQPPLFLQPLLLLPGWCTHAQVRQSPPPTKPPNPTHPTTHPLPVLARALGALLRAARLERLPLRVVPPQRLGWGSGGRLH